MFEGHLTCCFVHLISFCPVIFPKAKLFLIETGAMFVSPKWCQAKASCEMRSQGWWKKIHYHVLKGIFHEILTKFLQIFTAL